MSEAMNPVALIETAGEVGFAVLPTVGEQLQAARKMRLLEVIDVAQALKLGPRQVEALENGDWQGLPGQTFVRGFVRNYARFVQIDPLPLMAQLDGVLQKPVDSLALAESKAASMPSGVSFGAPRRDRMVVVFGLLLVIAAALAYFLLAKDLSSLRETAQSAIDSLARKSEPEMAAAKPLAAPAEQAAAASAGAAVEPIFPPGTTPQQVMNPQALMAPEPLSSTVSAAPLAGSAEKSKLAVSEAQLRFVADKESWVEVRDRDSKVVFYERITPGKDREVSGLGPLSLVIGYAPGVKLYWRGQPIDLLPFARGEVARLVLE